MVYLMANKLENYVIAKKIMISIVLFINDISKPKSYEAQFYHIFCH